jgi:hypothetical protein
METKQLANMYQLISLSALVKLDVINIEDTIHIDGKYLGTLQYSSDGTYVVIENIATFENETQFKSLYDYICSINTMSNTDFTLNNIVLGNKKFQDVARSFFASVQGVSSLSDALTAIGLNTIINVMDVEEMQSNEYWILRYIDDSSENEFGTDNDFQYFTNIGFEYSSAQCCSLLVQKYAYMSSQNWTYWAKCFVNAILRYKTNLLPKGVSSTPSILTKRVSRNFTNRVFAVCSSKDDVDSEDLLSRLKSKMIDGNGEEYYMFFHGTSYASANAIIAEGINLSRGFENQDFSHGNGFYLHTEENINLAYMWSQRGYRESAAIIVFIVLKSEFEQLSVHIKDNDLETWQRYVNLYRRSSMIEGGDENCEDMFDDYDELQSNFNYNIVFGFGCKNHRDVVRFNRNPQPFEWKQVCLRSERAVNIFNQSNVGVMYL